MDYNYLVPANSKKQTLILGLFKPIDAIILGVGAGISFLLFFIVSIETIKGMILAILPTAIAAFLVFPMPNYHNVRVFFREMWDYLSSRKKYKWRGWCYKYDQPDE